jgi:hypothetical protein
MSKMHSNPDIYNGRLIRDPVQQDPVFLLRRRVEIFDDCGDVIGDRWEVESAWFDREEARAWGESHRYRFPPGVENVDWDVYAVSGKGQLVTLMDAEDQRRAKGADDE